MRTNVGLSSIYVPSEDVVARLVNDEFIIIPITATVSDSEDKIFSLNKFGKAIWDKLNGKRDLKTVVEVLTREFSAPRDEIERDCLGLIKELLKKRIIIEI